MLDNVQSGAARAALVGGSILGAGALSLLVGFVAADHLAAAGGAWLRLSLMLAVASAVAGACAGVWLATGALLQRLLPGRSWRAALVFVSLAWWPAAALVPLPLSLATGGAAAHRLLRVPDEATTFVVYLLAWMVVLHTGLLCGALLARRALREPAPELAVRHGEMRGPSLAVRGLAGVLGLAVTGAALLNWGVVQQLTTRQGEFASHSAAARAMMRGALPYALNLDIWAQINVPPATLLLVYAPWLWLPEELARVVYAIAHVGAFATALYLLLRRLLAPPPSVATALVAAVLVGSIYSPWRESAWLGQPNGFIFLALSIALLAALNQRWSLAATLVVVSLVFKPVAVWMLPYLLVARRMRALAGAALAGTAIVGFSTAIVGTDLWRVWLLDKLPLLARGTTHHTSISLPVLHNRLFLTSHAYYLSAPPPDLPLAALLNGLTLVSAVLLLVALIRPRRAADDRLGHALEFSLALCLSLAVSPLTWLHYATAALIAFVVLMAAGRALPVSSGPKRALVGLGVVAFVLLSVDQELFLLRTAALWEHWPLLGSLSNFGLPVLVAAAALALWLHDRTATASCSPAASGQAQERIAIPRREDVPPSVPKPLPLEPHPVARP